MVDDLPPPRKRKIVSVAPLCKIKTDKLGVHYGIDRDGIGCPSELWWDRSLHKGQELLFVRQENGEQTADVLMLTLGQVYSLIDALNRAVMSK